MYFFMQTFLSELYVYLIDQMHESLGKTLSLEDQAPVPSPLTESVNSPMYNKCDPSHEKGRVGCHIVKFTFSAF